MLKNMQQSNYQLQECLNFANMYLLSFSNIWESKVPPSKPKCSSKFEIIKKSRNQHSKEPQIVPQKWAKKPKKPEKMNQIISKFQSQKKMNSKTLSSSFYYYQPHKINAYGNEKSRNQEKDKFDYHEHAKYTIGNMKSEINIGNINSQINLDSNNSMTENSNIQNKKIDTNNMHLPLTLKKNVSPIKTIQKSKLLSMAVGNKYKQRIIQKYFNMKTQSSQL